LERIECSADAKSIDIDRLNELLCNPKRLRVTDVGEVNGAPTNHLRKSWPTGLILPHYNILQ
jgi:hypothetical protein